MGLNLFTSSCSSYNCTPAKQAKGNPNSLNFRLQAVVQFSNYTYAEIVYPDCKNFEGEKVVVFYGQVAEKISRSGSIDPHFCPNHELSIAARFEPTVLGKANAVRFAKG